MYKYLKTATLILLFSANILAQTFEPVNLDDYEFLVAVKSYTDPIVQIKDVDGKLIKNVRIPDDGLSGLLTYDNKYLIVQGKQAIHRVAINSDETISIPYELMVTSTEGVLMEKAVIWTFTQFNDKVYMYDKVDQFGPSIKEKINIYEVDFNTKTISTYMTVPINASSYAIQGSMYNKYLMVSAQPGKVDIYNIENKSLFKSLNFDVQPDWGSRKTDSYMSRLIGTELFYWMSNYGSTDASQKAAFKASYNLSTNKIMHQEFRTGDDADVMYVFQPETQKIYWTKSSYQGAITEWKMQIFDDKNLSNIVFEFTGVLMWQFDKNDPNLIDVTYHSGKIETYNLTTKELIATKNNGGGLNDF